MKTNYTRLLLLFSFLFSGEKIFAQNIGINTDGSAGATLLHTKNTTALTHNYLRVENTQGGYQSALQLLNSGTAGADWIQYIPGGTTDLRFYRGADLVHFLANGNVGIGVSPTMKLHVVGPSTTANDATIFGNSTGASGQVYGVLGQVASTSGNATGVKGVASGATGGTNGVWGTNASATTDAAGVWGEATSASGAVYGVFGTSASTTSPSSGVLGKANGATGLVYGVTGISVSSGGVGVFGDAWNTTAGGTVYGVYGRKRYGMTTGTGYGIYGTAEGTGSTNIGGYFTATGATANYGIIVPSGGGSVGIGTSTPVQLLDITGSFNMPLATSGTVGMIRSNDTRFVYTSGTNNTFVGLFSGNATTANMTGQNNSGFGQATFGALTSGLRNTALGENALNVLASGNDNTAAGVNALRSNVSGTNNTAGGVGALEFYTGSSSTAVGYFALNANANVNAVGNDAFGANALKSNTYARYNTAIGQDALSTQSFANGSVAYDGANTAIGYRALFANQPTATTSGSYGADVVFTMSQGTYNVAAGYKALTANTSGCANIAVGGLSLQANTTGYNNTACGDEVLNRNTSGDSNTGLGVTTLYFNTIGYENTAVGRSALAFNTIGNMNTALGIYSMYFNNSGSDNVGIGRSAIRFCTAGNKNAGVGQYALQNTTGSNNTGLGYFIGATNVGGANNTFVGYLSDAGGAALSNATALGNGAIVNASSKVRIGNATLIVNGVEGGAAYFNASDKRFKFNIQEDVSGLEFITKLRPVNYQFDTKKFDEFLMKNMPDSVRRVRMKDVDYVPSTSIIHTGFIAQEVDRAAKESGFIFEGVYTPKDDSNDYYTIAYAQFVVPLVKSVQELSAKSEAQQKTIEQLLKRIEVLENSKAPK